MFAVYTYNSSATQANVKADILLLLTGTVLTASLSASCNKPSSSILATYNTAGWSSYDSSAYTNGVVVNALQQDGVTSKYVGIDITSTTLLTLHAYEAWNSGAHTATNDVSTTIALTLSAGGVLYIYATQQGIWIGNGGSTTMPIGALEIDNTLGTVPAGYPTTFVTSSDIAGKCPRIKHPNSTGDLTTSSTFAFCAEVTSSSSTTYQKGRVYRNSSEVVCLAMAPPVWTFGYVAASSATACYGSVGKILGGSVYGNGIVNPAIKDTVVIGSTTYIMMGQNAANAITTTNLWVPQG